MKRNIRWGILSTAKIGRQKVIPAIQNASNCEVVAIASRDIKKAGITAKELGIETVYGSYDGLLSDSGIDIIYNPLPNNMHVPWTIKALEQGKHVLCEKPIGLNVEDALVLATEMKKYPHLKVMEAFMYKFHPQWRKVKSLVDNNTIGKLKSVQTHFSYYNIDPDNIRNKVEVGGGALMDIGCYCISFPRYLTGREPEQVTSLMDRDPQMKTDCLTSGILDFSDGVMASFTCATQLMPYQRTLVIGAEGRIEIEIPVNAPPNEKCRIWLTTKEKQEQIVFDAVDQYQLQAEAFAYAVINDLPVPISFQDSIGNMKVIDAIVESTKCNGWVKL